MKKEKEKEVRNQLTAAEYWEWRTTICELQLEEKAAALAEAEIKLMSKDAEILAIRAQLNFRVKMEAAKQKVEAAKSEYSTFKKKLEDSLGCSLNGKMIDEHSFEVKELPVQSP